MSGRVGRAALVLLTLVVLAACSGVPSHGVRAVATNPQGAANAFVHLRAPGPQAGLSPRAVVSRFLGASAGFDEGFGTARKFLAPGAAQRWRPEAGVLVFDALVPTPAAAPDPTAGSDASDPGSSVQVVTGRVIAVVAADGRYAAVADPQPVVLRFRLAATGPVTARTWQITGLVGQGGGIPVDLSSGVLLDRLTVSQAMAPLWLWWPSPSLHTLVPEPVLLARGTGTLLQRTLVERLLAGPPPALRDSVAAAAPPGTTVAVTLGAGGTVYLTPSGLQDQRADQRRALAAALSATLGQPGLGVEGVVLGADRLERTGLAGAFDSSTDTRPDHVLAVEAGHAVAVPLPQSQPATAPSPSPGVTAAPAVKALPRVAAFGALAVRYPTQARLGGRYAAVSADRRSLLASGSEGTVRSVLSLTRTGRLGAPSIDANGTVWVLDRTTGTVYVCRAGSSSADRVDPPSGLPAGYRVVAAEPAPDGARVALVLRSTTAGHADRLVVAPVTGAAGGSVAAGLGRAEPFSALSLGVVLPGAQVLDIDWSEPLLLTLLLGGSGTTGPVLAPVQLGQLAAGVAGTPPNLPQGTTSVAVPSDSSRAPLVIQATVKGKQEILVLKGRGLRSGVIDPAYAG